MQNLICSHQFFREFIFLDRLCWGMAQWLGAEKGWWFSPYGISGSDVLDTFLVVTTGWEWGTGSECVEIRDAARCPPMLLDGLRQQRKMWPNMSIARRLRHAGAVDDFIFCKRYCELTPYFRSLWHPSQMWRWSLRNSIDSHLKLKKVELPMTNFLVCQTAFNMFLWFNIKGLNLGFKWKSRLKQDWMML